MAPTFQQQIEQLTVLATQTHLDGAELKAALLVAQDYFQQQILSANLEDLSEAEQNHRRAVLVEIDKQLKLLNLDMTFIQAARQPATIQQRQAHIVNRLQLLQTYGAALRSSENQDSAP